MRTFFRDTERKNILGTAFGKIVAGNLVLDEVKSALDAETDAAIVGILLALEGGLITVMRTVWRRSDAVNRLPISTKVC